MEKTLNKLAKRAGLGSYSFTDEFIQIVADYSADYSARPTEALKGFFNDLAHGGCASGIVGEFVYTPDCNEFYLNNIDGLEGYVCDLEDEFGKIDSKGLPRSVFVCWLCFEEFCRTLSNLI